MRGAVCSLRRNQLPRDDGKPTKKSRIKKNRPSVKNEKEKKVNGE